VYLYIRSTDLLYFLVVSLSFGRFLLPSARTWLQTEKGWLILFFKKEKKEKEIKVFSSSFLPLPTHQST
jgi:hypothetical protein